MIQQTVEDIHDILVPDALEYYLGLNEDFDMLGMEDDSGDEDSDDEEGDSKPPRKKSGDKGGKKGGDGANPAGAGAEGQEQECKQ